MSSSSSATPNPAHSLRGWLRHLAATGRLTQAREGVRLEYELAAIARHFDGQQATYFPEPGGHPFPVVSGLISDRRWIAEAMGVPRERMLAHYREAVANPLPWRELPANEAPVQQEVCLKFDIRHLLPVPRHNEHDSAPYITAGLLIARNPRTGVQNVSIHRIQVNAPDRMEIGRAHV